ncbi:MAG: DinB family protein [bacterium]
MDPQTRPFVEIINTLHEAIFKAVEGLTDAEINWRHPNLSNTIGILLRHVAGSERYWIVEVVGGRPIHRERDAEFAGERLAKQPLVDALRAAQAEVTGVMGRMAAGELSTEVQLRDPPRTIPKAQAILHSIQHTAYHLGQIQLLRKMAGTPSGPSVR